MYPSFNEVFTTDKLLGIFYPLCTVDEHLHFVSSNGLWMDEKYAKKNNTSQCIIFKLKNGKYEFEDDLRRYKGYKYAKKIFPILKKDFKINGNVYLQKKLSTNFYIKQIKKSLPFQTKRDIDLEYYLETFYSFYFNKLIYNLNGEFGEFNHFIEGSVKPEKSPVVYGVDEMDNIPVEKTIPQDYYPIGMVIGYEFFTDGNNSNLYFNQKENKILSINSYD